MINRYIIGGVLAFMFFGVVCYKSYLYGYDSAVIDNAKANEAQLELDADNADILSDAEDKRVSEVKENIKYVYLTKDDSGCLDSELDDGLYNLVR
jgi:hypothetical protein